MKKFTLALAALLVLAGAALPAELSLPKEVIVKPGRLFKVEAKTDAKQVKWVNLHPDIDLIPDSSGKFAIGLVDKDVLAKSKGQAVSYKIAAYAWDEKGATDPAFTTVGVEGEAPPAQPPAPGQPPPGAPKADPVNATVKIRMGNSGCTATVIYPRRADGRWDILCAAHCVTRSNTGTIQLKDGRTLKVTVQAKEVKSDICWLATDDVIETLPYAVLARSTPAVGTRIWHMGYGVDRPGNRETGTVTGTADRNHMLWMKISVSSGDSGSAQFREDTGEVVATLYGTSTSRGVTSTIGGGCVRAWELRPKSSAAPERGKPDEDEAKPVPLPCIVVPERKKPAPVTTRRPAPVYVTPAPYYYAPPPDCFT
jgi:S1-C subfamily serine protease